MRKYLLAALALAALILIACAGAQYAPKKLDRIQHVGASQFGGKRDPGVGCQGAGGDLCKHPWSFGELSNNPHARPLDFAALGHLPMHTHLLVCLKRCAVLEKRDVGAGAGILVGHYRLRIDLWWKAADYIGVDEHKGVAVVRVKRTKLPLGPVRSNGPTRSPKPAGPTKAHGRTVSTNCSTRTLVHNDRGACIRSVQWLLAANDPSWRPTRARKHAHGHDCGANCAKGYWRIRPGKPSGVYGKATILEVQKAKYRLGYPAGQANGAAGPKFRAYLLGRPLPAKYVDAKENRYQAWRKARSGPNPKVKHLIELAYRAISLHDHFYYTQTSHRSDFLTGLGPPYPKGGDCSGSVAALYRLSFGSSIQTGSYSPWDWTGSMQDRGRIVWRAGQSLTRLRPGDLVFYGYGSPFHHVAMVIAPGRVYSFGQQGCPCNNSTLYRDDARIARRYVPDSWTR